MTKSNKPMLNSIQ